MTAGEVLTALAATRAVQAQTTDVAIEAQKGFAEHRLHLDRTVVVKVIARVSSGSRPSRR
jgi:hypothetical protein